jgi:chromosome segregation ATPase
MRRVLNENRYVTVQKVVVICVVLFCLCAFALTGIKSYTGRGADNNAPSVELERISRELDGTEKQLGDAGSAASDLAAGLQSAAADVGEIQRDGGRLEQTISAAGKQAAAIGSGLGDISVTDTAIRETVRRIECFIEETNKANGIP